MSKYNGHKNWDYWNVSLWLSNDECLYSIVMRHIRNSRTRQEAARAIFDELNELDIEQTPDGAAYNVTRIRAALVGL